MSDLIDRQAAIDAIKASSKEIQHWLWEAEGCESYCEGVADVETCLDDLPSAQPEQDCILKQFGNCSYSETGCSDCAIKVKIRKALPSAQPEIIRCKDCKYAEVADPEDSQDGYTCQFHRGSIWFSGSFCSWAERREE